MTKDECISAIANGEVPSSCISGIVSDSSLQTLESIFTIGSAVAIIVTAVLIWKQLHQLKIQVIQGKDGAIKQIGATRDTAFQQIDAGRTNTKLNATLNLLAQVQTNPQWYANRKKFIEVRKSNKIREHALTESEEAICVRQQLNQYELIALGIFYDIIDEKMYRHYYRGTVLSDWTECMPFINAEREKNDQAWVQLEKLVNRFKEA